MEKTNKQKCLEQWKWLRDNPGKSKHDYFIDVLGFSAKKVSDAIKDYNLCFACKVAFNNDCENCPIEWYSGEDKEKCVRCEDYKSPFSFWLHYNFFLSTNPNDELEKAASCANQICVLIENTWKDD